MDDIFNQRKKKNVENIPFKRLNNYYLNIKLTFEVSLSKFFDTKSLREWNLQDNGTHESNKIGNTTLIIKSIKTLQTYLDFC